MSENNNANESIELLKLANAVKMWDLEQRLLDGFRKLRRIHTNKKWL